MSEPMTTCLTCGAHGPHDHSPPSAVYRPELKQRYQGHPHDASGPYWSAAYDDVHATGCSPACAMAQFDRLWRGDEMERCDGCERADVAYVESRRLPR